MSDLTSNLSADLRSPDYNDESDGHVRFRAADEIDRLKRELDKAREANRLAIHTGLMQEALIADLLASDVDARIAELEAALKHIADPLAFHTIQEMREIAKSVL
jgi:hypothetical protein